jgi:predicted phage terminase large subunit-like protein
MSLLTREEKIELVKILEKKQSFTDWFLETIPSYYSFPPHIQYLCSIADKVIRGELQNVAISLPPGHGKSQTITTRLPIYWAQRNPQDAVVFTGYNQTFANKSLSYPARELAKEMRILAPDSEAMEEWRLTNGARLIARGVGSAPTGINPISLLVCDDPIKDRAQAESEVERENIWTWWTGSIVQRFYPRTKAFIIATRWHEDDLIGRLKAQNDKSWTFINLPAIAEADDPLGRAEGEALWEAKPIEFLESIRAQMSEYNFQALFQGNPTPKEGALFKVDKLKFIDKAELPESLELVRKWDVAASIGKGDYTAGVLLGKDNAGRFYVLDVQRFQEGTDTRNNRMVATAHQDGTRVRIIVPEDPGSAGKDVAIAFIRMLAGFTVKALRETGSKELRADTFASQVNAGNVYILRSTWNYEYIEELRNFPAGKNDDMVDASAGAFNELVNKSSVYDW